MPDHPDNDTVVRDLVAVYTLVIRSIVDEPESAFIEPVYKGAEVCFRLTLAKGDVGKVIGRQGVTHVHCVCFSERRARSTSGRLHWIFRSRND